MNCYIRSVLFFEVCCEHGIHGPSAQAQSVPSAPHTDGEGCNLYSCVEIQFFVTHILYTCANIYALNLHEQMCKGVLKYLFGACTFAPACTRRAPHVMWSYQAA